MIASLELHRGEEGVLLLLVPDFPFFSSSHPFKLFILQNLLKCFPRCTAENYQIKSQIFKKCIEKGKVPLGTTLCSPECCTIFRNLFCVTILGIWLPIISPASQTPSRHFSPVPPPPVCHTHSLELRGRKAILKLDKGSFIVKNSSTKMPLYLDSMVTVLG